MSSNRTSSGAGPIASSSSTTAAAAGADVAASTTASATKVQGLTSSGPSTPPNPSSTSITAGANTSVGKKILAAIMSQPTSNDNVIVVPYHSDNGLLYTEDTKPSDFKDWAAYITFCQQGPQVRIQCANAFDTHGAPVSFFETPFSKKLLRDFSGYFDAMFRSGMKEAVQGRVAYEDVATEDFTRLYLCLVAGGPAARSTLGSAAESMTNLLNVYILADRFQMRRVREWVHASILDCMHLSGGWKDLYSAQVLQQQQQNQQQQQQQATLAAAPASTSAVAPAVAFHKSKVVDWAAFHLMQKELPREVRPVAVHQFLDYFIDNCPGEALDDCWGELDDEFRIDVGHALVRKIMMTCRA